MNRTIYQFFLNCLFLTICFSAFAKMPTPTKVSKVMAPSVNLGRDKAVCVGTSVTLDAGNPGAAYSWSMGGAATQTRTVTSAVAGIFTYIVSVTITSGTNTGTTLDTIKIEYLNPPAAPTVNNVTTCQGSINLTASSTSGSQILWFTAATGGNFLGFGSPLLYNASTSSTVYAQAWNQSTLPLTAGITAPQNSSSATAKGLKFDVLSPITLGCIKVYAALSGSINVELKNGSGQVLKTWSNLPVVGNSFLTTISLGNYPINTGNNYTLTLKSISPSGNTLRFYDSGSTNSIYPIATQGLISIKEWGAADVGKYYYFYDICIGELACSSNTTPLNITVLSTPNVSFGADSVACGVSSVALSMPTGGTYSWSTGATTQNITVNSPGGMIIGETTFGTGCSDKDTINVLFSTTPTPPTVSNVTTCVGSVNLTANSGANSKIIWRDANTANAGYVGTGSPYNYNATTSTTLYAEAYNVSNPINFSYAALPAINGTVNITSPKGLIFDVIRPIILDSVTVYARYVGKAYIEVQKSNGAVVARKLVDINPTASFAPVRVGLGFTITPGTGYRLYYYLNQSDPTNTIKTHIGSFPQQIQGYVKITGSTSGSNTYVGFYDWEVRLLTCPSPKVPLSITVNPTPSISLGNDTVQCGGTIALSMGSANSSANPTWKNLSGTTLGTGINLTVTSANDGTIIAEATTGSCTKRDTINAEILSTPSAPTATNPPAACAGAITVTANAGTNQILWWDAATGGNVIGSGNSLNYTTAAGNCSGTTTTTLYAQSYATSQFKRNVGFKNVGSSYISAAGTGFRFDVNAGVTIKLDSVTIYAASSGAFVLELYNSAGTLLQSKQINVTGNANAQDVYVGFIVYSGTDYILKVKNGSIFNLWFTSGASTANYYPLSIPGFLTIKSGVAGTSTNVLNRYYGLYDWKVTVLPCGSATRTPVVISTLPTPNVNLGTDQITCGSSVILNAGACAGATFSWMNNSTTQTLTVSAAGITTAAVTVSKTTNGITCTDRDTARINIISSPTLGSMPPLQSCGGYVTLNAIETIAADTVLWWNAATNGNVITSGNPANYYFTSSQTVYAQGFNASAISLDVAPKAPDLIAVAGGINKGIVFDVETPLWIEYVTLYTQSAGTLNIELLNNQGVVLKQKFVSTLANYAPSQVNLGFFVVKGTGYRLRLSSSGAGYVYADVTNPTTFYTQSLMSIFNGTNNDITIKSSFDGNNFNVKNFYYYFYDWKVRPYRCSSARVPKTVTILPTPVNSLPKDTISCGGAITLCSPAPGASQVWTISPTSAGTSSASCATINSSASVILKSTYSSSNCSDADTVQVEISSTPSQLTANDATLCPGEATVIATSNADYVAWFDAPTDGNLVTFGDTASFYAISDTILYVQGYNITQFAKPAGLATWTQNAGNMVASAGRGLFFDVYKPLIIDTVSIYLNTPTPTGSITINLLDKDLNTIGSKVFNSWSVQTVGTKYIQKIPLGFFASPNPYGSYSLVLKTNSISTLAPSDNKLGFEQTNAFPFSIANALYINAGHLNGTPNLSNYYYFFDWKVRFGACETQRQGVNITLYPSPTHIVNLGADFITCGDTILNPGNYPTGYTFEWNTLPPIYTQTLPTSQSGTYIVTVDNLNGCGVSDTINATINPLPLAAGTVTVGANRTITFNSIGSSLGTLSWNFAQGATSQLAFGNYTYPATASCNQTVTLVVQNDCGTDNITFPINICGVGIDEDFAQQVNVYPNPTSGLLHIEIKGLNRQDLSMTLIDMLGREIMSKNINTIENEVDTLLNVQQVAAGMYQLILSTSDNKVAVKKIMIQH